jgi:hypothetical protein
MGSIPHEHDMKADGLSSISKMTLFGHTKLGTWRSKVRKAEAVLLEGRQQRHAGC